LNPLRIPSCPSCLRAFVVKILQRQLEEPLGEGHRQRILPMAGGVPVPIELIHRLILDRDVRRVADHRVVLLPEDAVQGI
jgi:hypothetical protein